MVRNKNNIVLRIVRLLTKVTVNDKILRLALCVLCSVLIGLNCLVNFAIRHDGTFRLEANRLKSDFSILCEALSLSPDEDYTNMKVAVDSNGRYICTSKDIAGLTEQAVERIKRIRLAKGLETKPFLFCGNERLRRQSGQQSAYLNHVMGHQNHSDIIHWSNDSKLSHISMELEYNKGVITISERRNYFIYASVLINYPESNQNPFSRPFRFSLRICKKSYGYEDTLIGKTEILSEIVNGSLTSIYIFGNFRLEQNDQIYVRVSDASQLVLQSKGNTFGVTPL